ncbi:hypothetical protein Bache_1802 [Bacteroides helcogenes P 36-108]|uniref:NigD-like C-terminal beta sandwich domain-containing protein n=2 Tax=Bacteroides helcogenes TaxID=290053 RepID=E6SP14_BACT6|nr:hypothetical protein Bache_1802 [Bacteroides helcogenes P 36-108]
MTYFMKKPSITLITSILLLLNTFMLQSCLDNDWDNQYPSLFATGTLKLIKGNDYYFALDEGSRLYPGDTTALHNYTIIDGQRAFVYFDKLNENKEGYEYNAQIKHIENILTKDIYFMTADKIDSIGSDRINIIEPIWITGNYINIKFQIYNSNNQAKKHLLNLVINESSASEKPQSDYVNLEFRHNAYDDNPIALGTGLVSFKLDNIADLLKDKKGLRIHVKSLYDGEKYITLDFQKK